MNRKQPTMVIREIFLLIAIMLFFQVPLESLYGVPAGEGSNYIAHEVISKPSYVFVDSTQNPPIAQRGQTVEVTWIFRATAGQHREGYIQGDNVPKPTDILQWGVPFYGPINAGGTTLITKTRSYTARGSPASFWGAEPAWFYDPCDNRRMTSDARVLLPTHNFVLSPAPPNTSNRSEDGSEDLFPEPGPGPGSEPGPKPEPGPEPGPETPAERPDQGEVALTSEIFDPTSFNVDPDRGSKPTRSDGYVVIKKTDPADLVNVGSNDVNVELTHRIVTIHSPDARDLKGLLKLDVEPGSVPGDYVIFHFDSETGARKTIMLPFQMEVTEPGHEGGGVHDFHAGYEQFSFRRIGDGALTLKVTVAPNNGAPFKTARLHLLPVEIKAFKRGTLNAPGAEVPAGTGEFGYETVLMENADSESSAPSITRDCDESGAAADLNPYRNAEDDDLVKIVLKWPAGIKPAGASLKLLHVGMQVDARQTTADAAVSTDGPSRLNFYKADGTRITNPTTDLQIADLANAPASSYLSKILTDGELTIFIEGADHFGDLPANRMDRLGGAQIRWEFTQGATTATAKLLVYRGGFLRFMQPAGAPGAVGDFEFWDGKGRVKNKVGKPIFGKEFETDVTDYGTKLATWKAKSGKTTGKAYNIADKNGHTPPGWWSYFGRDVSASQDDQTSGSGNAKKIEQGGYVRWKQDDETNTVLRYTTDYWYDASKAHDRSIGDPTKIKFKYEMVPIAPSEGQNRTYIQIHPDGDKDGTAGCIGIKSYEDCKQVAKVLERFTKLKVKVQIK